MQSSFEPQVSIITRTKNRTLLLQRAIESVLSQSFEDWEQIVVNDGGDSIEINELVQRNKERLKNRLRVIENHRSPGRWGAANAGLLAARGRYFILLDDDDTWVPNFLEVVVAAFRKLENTNVRAVATQSVAIFEEVIDGDIRELHREPYNPNLSDVTLFRMAGGAGRYLQPNAVLFSVSLRQEVGLFNEELPVIGDWEYNLRVLQTFDFFVIQEMLACYHHRVSKCGSFANSIFANSSDHQLHYTRMLNQSLREDLLKGQYGIGFLMNVSRAIADSDHCVGELKARLAGLDSLLIGLTEGKSGRESLTDCLRKQLRKFTQRLWGTQTSR